MRFVETSQRTGRVGKGDIMVWGIAIGAYLAVGVATAIWLSARGSGEGSDRRQRSGLLALMIPEVCLLWPFILVIHLRHRRSEPSIHNDRRRLQ